MTLNDLGSALKAIQVNDKPLKFAAYGWASAPTGSYGVYGQYGADQFEANNRYGESLIRADVDWYTRTDDEVEKDAIEACFKELQDSNAFAWYLNTVQYEEDTGFIHYEWNVELL